MYFRCCLRWRADCRVEPSVSARPFVMFLCFFTAQNAGFPVHWHQSDDLRRYQTE